MVNLQIYLDHSSFLLFSMIHYWYSLNDDDDIIYKYHAYNMNDNVAITYNDLVCRHCSDKYHYICERYSKAIRIECNITSPQKHFTFSISVFCSMKCKIILLYWLKKKLSYIRKWSTSFCHSLKVYSLNLIQDFQSIKFYHDTSLSNSLFSFFADFHISNAARLQRKGGNCYITI